MNCISDTIIWHWQEEKENKKVAEAECGRAWAHRVRWTFDCAHAFATAIVGTANYLQLTTHLLFDIDSDIEILWLHCRSIRFGCSVPRRSPFTEMIYKLRLVSLLDEICSCPQRNQRLNGFKNIMHILTLQREDQVVSPSTATTFCKMLHFHFDFFTGENERIIVQQFRISKASQAARQAGIHPATVSCKTKLLWTSTHFDFDIVSILRGLFVFETVSGLIKPPHKTLYA